MMAPMSKGSPLRRLGLAWLSVLLLASCASGPRPPLETLADAARAARGGGGSARERALAAWHAWIVDADTARMESLADGALAKDDADPWARLALAESARRRLDPHAEARELAALIRGAPSHPLAAVAARRLASLTALSTSLDREIEAAASELLASRGLDPDAAAKLRAALRRANGETMRGAVADAGAITAAAVVGPFSPWHHLDLRTPFPPERSAVVAGSYEGPAGRALALRPFSLPDGTISLAPEERGGDVYYALSVAEVPAAGRHVVRFAAVRTTSVAIFVDGAEVLRREAIGAPQPIEGDAAIELTAGAHLVAVRVVKGSGPGDVGVSFAPADGSPSRITWRAAREGDRPGVAPRLEGSPRFASARRLATLLQDEGGLVGAYVAAGELIRVDREGAKDVLASAIAAVPNAPPLLQLRADLARSDDGIPQAIGQARAAADLEAALSRDPANPRALWSAAAILRDAGRHDEAADKLAAAEAQAKSSAILALAKARVALARGFDVQAWRHAREAVAADAGFCEAGSILVDLARRADAAGDLEDAAQRFAACPGGRARLAGVLASRGHEGEATEALRALVAEDPQDPSPTLRLSERLLSAGDAAGAAAIVAKLESHWPRSSFLPRRRAQLLERAGDAKGARAARDRALLLDGGDLAARRMDAFRDGTDLLAKYDRDGLEVIRSFEKTPRKFDTATVVLFDFAAVEAYADGSFVERVHTISKVLDKRGIDELGEAHVPGGAEVVHLRTIKKDGRILEPESIAGKESISLPNLDVGDYVELEFLQATSPRGDGMPGWSASPFYFRSEGTPLLESVYVVRAPKGVEVDAHNGAPQAEILEDGDVVTLRMTSRDNTAFVPEPGSVRGDEFLPWVQVGTGADEASVAWLFADGLAGATDRSAEVAAWARGIAASVRTDGADRTPIVRAIYDRAMEEIDGSDASATGKASQVLAQKRGSRALLIKAALDELGIPNRWAVVRTWDQSPLDLRFPRTSRWAYLALVVRPDPQGGQLWLDPSMRWAPFGRLAPLAEGSPALLLPESGTDRPQATGTPAGSDAPRGRVVEVLLTLGEDGTLKGEGTERYLGFDAAWARGSLEKIDDDRRRQAVESALAKGFRGLTLDDLTVDPPGDTLTLRYRFTVPEAARELGQGLRSMDLDFFAAGLGRRFLARGDRETSLFLRAPEKVETRIQIELPPSLRIVGAPDAAREKGAFGDYKRSVAASPSRFAIEESLELSRGRVRPHEYRDFARWVMAVDRAQAAELVLAPDATAAR